MNRLMKALYGGVLGAAALLNVACGATPTPEVIERVVERTVVVTSPPEVIERVVERTVVVTSPPEVIEREVVVTATPTESADTSEVRKEVVTPESTDVVELDTPAVGSYDNVLLLGVNTSTDESDYSLMYDHLLGLNYNVHNLGRELDSKILSEYGVVIWDNYNPKGEGEIDALYNWVRSGGGIVVISSYRDKDLIGRKNIVLLRSCDIQMNFDEIKDERNEEVISSRHYAVITDEIIRHEITENIERVYVGTRQYSAIRSSSLSTSDIADVLVYGENSTYSEEYTNRPPLVSSCEHGGRVAVSSASFIFNNYFWDYNKNLLLNMAEWVSGRR